MQKIIGFLILIILSINVLSATQFSSNAYYQVCFTPAQSCKRKITNHIYAAKKSIAVQAYSFTSKAIAYALINAKRRGVNVRVIIDKTELTNPSRLYLLLKNRVPVWLDDSVTTAHNKVMIFDRTAVLTGSYNFTNAAEYKNAENSLYIYDPHLAMRYYQNWVSRLQSSKVVTLDNLKQLQQRYRLEN